MEQRVLIVGPGNISRHYLEAIAKTEGMRVVGVVGRDADKTAAYARQNGIPQCGTNLAEVAGVTRPTMSLVCTPHAHHYEAVMESARLGLHVLCEKPLHFLPAKQEKMIRSCRDSGVTLGVSFLFRFLSHMKAIKRLITSGRLGDVLVLNARSLLWREPEYYTLSSWHGTKKIDGGGPFIQQASHLIDLALWLGGGYEHVYVARRFTLMQPIEVEDHGYAVLKYRCGAVGTIEASTVSRGLNVNELEIIGTGGSIVAGFDGIRIWNVDGEAKPVLPGDSKLDKASLFQMLIADFKEAVEQKREPFVSGASAKTAAELIHRIYKLSGKPIRKQAIPSQGGRRL